jgi:hypothetical protein
MLASYAELLKAEAELDAYALRLVHNGTPIVDQELLRLTACYYELRQALEDLDAPTQKVLH